MRRRPRVGGRRGSVLIAVLWSLFFLAMLAVAVNAYVRPQMELSAKLLGKAKMYYLARAGVERAILEIENDATSNYDSLYDSWSSNEAAFKDVKLGGGTYSAVKPAVKGTKEEYGLTDEESKININRAPQSVLKNLFEKDAGLGAEEAGAIADSILDWVDRDDSLHKDGKESSYYEFLSEPYPCKNGYFEAPEELMLVNGVTREVFDKVKDVITIYGNGTVNVNTADARVLKAIGLSSEAAEKIISLRESASSSIDDEKPANVFTDASIIANVLKESGPSALGEAAQLARAAGILGVKSDSFRGTIKGSWGREGRSQDITFVYDRNDKLIKYWREE
jgi:type II secretory pathway component PulK